MDEAPKDEEGSADERAAAFEEQVRGGRFSHRTRIQQDLADLKGDLQTQLPDFGRKRADVQDLGKGGSSRHDTLSCHRNTVTRRERVQKKSNKQYTKYKRK